MRIYFSISAFGTIWRKTLRKMLCHTGLSKGSKHYGRAAQEHYAVSIDGKLTDWCDILIGVTI